MEGQSPWTIDSSASYHITFMLSSVSFPKNPHFITLAYDSNISSQGVS